MSIHYANRSFERYAVPAHDEMTGAELKAAVEKLGLQGLRLYRLLGMDQKPEALPIVLDKLYSGEREVSPTLARLVLAYLAGHRPSDWDYQPKDVNDLGVPVTMWLDTGPNADLWSADDLWKIRERFGFDRGQLAFMLGLVGMKAPFHLHRIEMGERPVRPAMARLMSAYLKGYRPPDWGDRGLEFDEDGAQNTP